MALIKRSTQRKLTTYLIVAAAVLAVIGIVAFCIYAHNVGGLEEVWNNFKDFGKEATEAVTSTGA